MERDEVIQECQIQNEALIKFLSEPHVLESLIRYTINLPQRKLDNEMTTTDEIPPADQWLSPASKRSK